MGQIETDQYRGRTLSNCEKTGGLCFSYHAGKYLPASGDQESIWHQEAADRYGEKLLDAPFTSWDCKGAGYFLGGRDGLLCDGVFSREDASRNL